MRMHFLVVIHAHAWHNLNMPNPYEAYANAPLSETEWIAREESLERAEMRRDLAAESRNSDLSEAEIRERDAYFTLRAARAHAGLARAAKAWAAGEIDVNEMEDEIVDARYYGVVLPQGKGPAQGELFRMVPRRAA
jgi:hypothetical protein